MSWELLSFLILGAVLLGGFAWYERSRPPAQVVALVAALAALAIAGRVAFAAFPNVKPTTDIVIFAGFALGAAPGFAVGALTALISNFWFGQGPWTPWQMAGWGLCGVLGALVAVGFRNAGRLVLAATCGFAGLAYGVLLNFSLMATYGGDLSWERFGVLAGRAIPFDVAHAVGNVVLALIAGPAIVRMLVRFRRRFEWERIEDSPTAPGPGVEPPLPPRRTRLALRGGGVGLFVAAALLLGALAPSPASADGPDSAVEWLRSVQNADGGFGATPGDDSGPEITAWTMIGLAASGINPRDFGKGGHTPVGFLRGHLEEVKSPGDLARTILALLSAGADPREFGGRNLVAELHSRRRDNGSYMGWPNSTAYAVVALRGAGSPGGTDKSLEWLRQVQNEDGGWSDEPGQASNAEATAAVLQAISPGSKASKRGLEFIRGAQQSNGGFRLGNGGPVNSQATAWATQGVLAAGAKLDSVKRGGATPLDYIASNQAPDGHYRYSKSSDQTPVWVTGQVLVALARKHFPVAPPPRREKPRAKPGSGAAANPTGGAAPAPLAPGGAPAPAIEPGPAPASGAGGAKSAPRPSVRGADRAGSEPGTDASGETSAPGPAPPAGGGVGAPDNDGSTASAKPASAGADSGGGGTSVAGSIAAGLLAGAALFGIGLLARKGWMRWRYGL